MHLQYLKRFYPEFRDKKILDLGCGRGDFLLECHKEGLDIVGIDINPEYIRISEEKLKKNGFKPNIIHGKGEKLSFNDNHFDFVNCVEVLEHTQYPEKVLMECYRVLKNDGQTFITIHNRFGAKDAHYRLWFLNWMPRFFGKTYIRTMKKYKDPGKFLDIQDINKMHYYTYRKFNKIVKQLGFEILDTKKKQLNNPEMILNEKNRKFIVFFKKIKLDFILNLFYYLLSLFYFNTFHFILKKQIPWIPGK